MKSYHLDPEKFNKEKRNITGIYGFIMFILTGIFVWMVWKKEINMSSLLILVAFLAMLVHTAYRSVKQRKQFFEGYRLELDENKLSQSQPNFPELIINRDEIKSVLENRSGLIISTTKAPNVLGITKDLRDEDYQEIKKILLSWVSIAKSESQDDENL